MSVDLAQLRIVWYPDPVLRVKALPGVPADETVRAVARRMIELNPHAPHGYAMLSGSLIVGGQLEDSIIASTTAWRLGRHEPARYDIANDLAWTHYLTGNYEAALAWGQQSLQLVDDYLQAHLVLAATHGQLGRSSEGQQHVTAILTALPDFGALKHRSQIAMVRDEDRDHFVDGLLKAGLPE